MGGFDKNDYNMCKFQLEFDQLPLRAYSRLIAGGDTVIALAPRDASLALSRH